ncbi:MAG TPA: hypothetical protein VGL40_12085 [Bacillota bacterium]
MRPPIALPTKTVTAKAALRLIWFYLSIVTFAAGATLCIQSGLGASPWDVFHVGVSGRIHVPLAIIFQATGLVVILIDTALGVPPTFGTVLNILTVGPVVQFLLRAVPDPVSLPARAASLLAGVLLYGVGTALYISSGLGIGPRDGLMVGLTRKSGLPVGLIRNGVDLTVSLAGWRLGGPLGLGTLVSAILVGPTVQLSLAVIARLARRRPFSFFISPVDLSKRILNQRSRPVRLDG